MSGKYQPYDVMPGDKCEPGDPVKVDRYTAGARINHWVTATSLVLLAISGLSLFHLRSTSSPRCSAAGISPASFIRGSAWCCFFGFLRAVPPLLAGEFVGRADNTWLARISDVLRDKEEKLPESRKYNAGQKMVFWSMSPCSSS